MEVLIANFAKITCLFWDSAQMIFQIFSTIIWNSLEHRLNEIQSFLDSQVHNQQNKDDNAYFKGLSLEIN